MAKAVNVANVAKTTLCNSRNCRNRRNANHDFRPPANGEPNLGTTSFEAARKTRIANFHEC
jgi:hypothetical protein